MGGVDLPLCGVPPLPSAAALRQLGKLGGCPGRFQVGCVVPMPISFDTSTGDLNITPRQELQPIALVLTPTTRAVTTIVWNNILGAEGKSIRLEGGGLSNIPYSVEQFTFEALRSNANPYPNVKGVVGPSVPLVYDFDATSAGIFSGTQYGFVPGLKGLQLACDAGWMGDRERAIYSKLHQWNESGECPAKLWANIKDAASSGAPMSSAA